MSRVILLQSIVHEGTVFAEGDCISLDDALAARLEKAGLLTIQAEKVAPAVSAPAAEEKPAKKADKKAPAKKKKAAL